MRHCQYPRSIIMTSVMQSHAAITHVRRQRASASRCRRHRHRNCHHHSSVTAAAARKCCGLTERHGGRAVIDCRHSAGAWLSFSHPPNHTHTLTHTHASVLARTAARGRIGRRRRRRRARVHQGATQLWKGGAPERQWEQQAYQSTVPHARPRNRSSNSAAHARCHPHSRCLPSTGWPLCLAGVADAGGVLLAAAAGCSTCATAAATSASRVARHPDVTTPAGRLVHVLAARLRTPPRTRAPRTFCSRVCAGIALSSSSSSSSSLRGDGGDDACCCGLGAEGGKSVFVRLCQRVRTAGSLS